MRLPPRVSFFTWEVTQEYILTIDKLKKRVLVLVNGCFLCLKDEDSCNHLVLSCSITFEMWSLVYRALGIDWVMARTVRDELWVWCLLNDRCSFADVITLTIWQMVWKERNRRTFDGVNCVNGFDILKNRWLGLKFLRLGHPTVVIETFSENLSLDDCDVNYL